VSAVLQSAIELAPRAKLPRREARFQLDIFSTRIDLAKKVFWELILYYCSVFFAVRLRATERAISRGDFSL